MMTEVTTERLKWLLSRLLFLHAPLGASILSECYRVRVAATTHPETKANQPICRVMPRTPLSATALIGSRRPGSISDLALSFQIMKTRLLTAELSVLDDCLNFGLPRSEDSRQRSILPPACRSSSRKFSWSRRVLIHSTNPSQPAVALLVRHFWSDEQSTHAASDKGK